MSETKTIKPSTSMTGIISKNGNYTKQTGDFYAGFDDNSIGRGCLEFDLSSIPSTATIERADLQLDSSTKLDSHFQGKVIIRSFATVDFQPSATLWSLTTIGPEAATVTFQNQGYGYSIPTRELLAIVKEAISAKRKLYLSIINTSESSKIIRFVASSNTPFLKITYSTGSSGGGNTGGGNTGSGEGGNTLLDDGTIIPLSLIAKDVGTTSFTLVWEEKYVHQFEIRQNSEDGPLVASLNTFNNEFSISGMKPDTYYTYYIKGLFEKWENRKYMGQYVKYVGSLKVLTKPAGFPAPPKTVRVELTENTWKNFNKGCFIHVDDFPKTNWPGEIRIYDLKFPYDGTYNTLYKQNEVMVGNDRKKYLIQNLIPNKTYYMGVSIKNDFGEGIKTLFNFTVNYSTGGNDGGGLNPLSGVPGYLSINYSTGSSGNSFISTWSFSSSTGTPRYIRDLRGQSFNSNYTYTGNIPLTITNTTNKEIICTPGSVSTTISSIGGTIYEMRSGAGNIIKQVTLAPGASTGIIVYFRFKSSYTFPVVSYGYGMMRVKISMSVKGGTTGSYTIANVYDKYILAWK